MCPLKVRFFSFSLLLLFLGGCGSLPNLEKFRRVPVPQAVFAHNPYFSETGKAHIYKAEISVYGKKITGTFVHKKTNDTLHRVALLSEFGNTLLDLSFGKNYSKLNYSIKNLDKKYIIAILVEDFRLLVLQRRRAREIYEKPGAKIMKTTVDDGFVYCFFETPPERLVKLTRTTKRKKKVTVYFSNFKKRTPKTIKLEHHNLKLDISLNAIPNPYAN